MNNYFLTPALVASALAMVTPSSAREDFIRETVYGDYLNWYCGYEELLIDRPISTQVTPGTYTGEFLSSLPLTPGGAHYALYDGTNPCEPLDEKWVGVFLPKPRIYIETEDESWPTPRTRADKPFWARIEMSGLLVSTEANPVPIEATRAQAFIGYRYPKNRTTFVNNSDPVVVKTFAITSNTRPGMPITMVDPVSKKENVYTQIPLNLNGTVLPPFRQMGEEYVEVWAKPDNNVCTRMLDRNAVQIWPVATISVLGIADNQKIIKSMPAVTFAMKELYPKSKTWVQIYSGAPVQISPLYPVAKAGTPIEGSVFECDQPTPQEWTFNLTPQVFNKYIPADGVYTMEVVTSTPFNEGRPERLLYVTFQVSRTVKVHGSVTGGE